MRDNVQNTFCLVLLGFACSGSLFLAGCTPRSSVEVGEKIPEIISITNVPDLNRYVLEFSKPTPREPSVPIRERKEPPLPVDHSLVQGRVLYADHNTNCSLWLMQSYMSSNWWEQQRLYVYSEKPKELQEITALAQKQITRGFVLSDKDCAEPLLVMSVLGSNDWSFWTSELWTYDLRSKDAKKLSLGLLDEVSPDHSKVLFEKLDEHGFHCLFLWNVNVGQIEPMLSLREPGEGSGETWDCRWSEDSEAVNITGYCSGFSKSKWKKYTELNLIYLVNEKTFYSTRVH